jgi:hypothetical protein
VTPERYQQINSLFMAAVDLNDSAREDFLREQCGNDDALLAAVRNLLDAGTAESLLPDQRLSLSEEDLD